MQSPPCRRAGEREFGGEVLLGLGHLVFDPRGEAAKRAEVVAHFVAHRSEFVDAERGHPFGEP